MKEALMWLMMLWESFCRRLEKDGMCLREDKEEISKGGAEKEGMMEKKEEGVERKVESF
jgi:hypothetical protein